MNRNFKDAGAYIDQVTKMESADGEKLSPNLMLTKASLARDLHRDEEAEADFRSVWNDHDSLTTLRLGAGDELALLGESHGHISDAEKMYKSTLAVYESERATPAQGRKHSSPSASQCNPGVWTITFTCWWGRSVRATPWP